MVNHRQNVFAAFLNPNQDSGHRRWRYRPGIGLEAGGPSVWQLIRSTIKVIFPFVDIVETGTALYCSFLVRTGGELSTLCQLFS